VESRITELEIKISYTEDLVEELNRIVYRQQQQIDLLAVEIRALREQARNAPQVDQAFSLRDEIPPHY
jgi:SlyX protein